MQVPELGIWPLALVLSMVWWADLLAQTHGCVVLPDCGGIFLVGEGLLCCVYCSTGKSNTSIKHSPCEVSEGSGMPMWRVTPGGKGLSRMGKRILPSAWADGIVHCGAGRLCWLPQAAGWGLQQDSGWRQKDAVQWACMEHKWAQKLGMTLTDLGFGKSGLLVYSWFTMKVCYHDLEKVVEAAFTVCVIIWYRYPVYWISHNLNVVEPVAS